MGAINHKKSVEETKSNSSVINLPLNSKKSSKDGNSLLEHDLNSELRSEVCLPIENEYVNSSLIVFPEKDEEIKNEITFGENDNLYVKKRSNSFAVKISSKYV